jgi:predicted nuclease of predicted toxin-antitoxin system
MIWLDAHLSPRVAKWIVDQIGEPAVPVRDIELREAEDATIWEAARRARVIVLTKDADFEERVRRLGPPPQIIWLTCGNTSEERLKKILTQQLPAALALLKQGVPLVEIQ